jgi:hypothetical protein
MTIDDIEIPTAHVLAEFEGVDLNDRRLESRALSTAAAFAARPRASIRGAARSTAEAEGIYRLLRNPRVSSPALLMPHVARTVERVGAEERVLIIHDTTEFSFGGETLRSGLGKLRGNDQGFLSHVSLAVSDDGMPLGVLAVRSWTRGDVTVSRRKGRKRSGEDYAKQGAKESNRWAEQIHEIRGKVAGQTKLLHIADREADAYPLLATLIEHHDAFVIRLARDRAVREDESADVEKIKAIAARARGIVQLDVPLTRRRRSAIPGKQKAFGGRGARVARLEIAATTVELRRPYYNSDDAPWIEVNVVNVREINTPEGETPVDWMLLTSEDVDTVRDVLAVVEAYKARWLIEEFFKALKSGCAIEKRELESLHTLTNALALFIPIASTLLLLRHLARRDPSTPVGHLFNPTQLRILQMKTKMPESPTAADALLAVAILGGYKTGYTGGRPPGWPTLGQGMERLLVLEEGWLAATKLMKEEIKR